MGHGPLQNNLRVWVMTTKIFYERDCHPKWLAESQVAIVGYGAQGQAHALNLRDSGVRVCIGQRAGGRGSKEATADGFKPLSIEDAAKSSDIVCLMLPDEVHGAVFAKEILPRLKPAAIVLTCHGFSFHYDLVPRNPAYRRLLISPKGQGHMVRGEYLNGGGVPCLIAMDAVDRESVLNIGLAYANAIGGSKAGIIETTIAAETETDLFGEQAVLCGGLTQLVQAGFDTLVDAGYQPELAYFECLHELKIIVDLMHTSGIVAMRDVISTTAEYGDYTRGPAIIDDHVRQNMRNVLQQIQSGDFAREFLKAQAEKSKVVDVARENTMKSTIEGVGQKLRAMMPWINPKKS